MPALALALLLLLLTAASARAAEPVALAEPNLGVGPVAIAGDEIVFADAGEGIRVRAAAPGREPVVRLEQEDPEFAVPFALAASPTRLAFGFSHRPRGAGDGTVTAVSRLLAGPAAGRLGFVAGSPDGRRSGEQVYGAALAGDVLVSVESVRDEGPARVLARDLAAGTPPAELVPPVPGTELLTDVRAAGRYVAYGIRRGGVDAVVELDRVARREAYRIELPRELEDFDLQADGKLAVAVPRTRDSSAIGWAAPGRAGVRDVAFSARRSPVRIAGDRIAYVRPAGAVSSELALSDLEGFARPVSFPLDEIEALAFDGRRLAFRTPSCVYAADLPGLAVRLIPPAGPCPRASATLTAPRRATLGGGRRVLRYEIGCPMATGAGCEGRLAVSYQRRGGRRAALAAARFTVRRGTVRTVSVPVDADAMNALAARASNRLVTLLTMPGQILQTTTRVSAPTRPAPPRRPAPEPKEGDGGEFVIGGS
ncbi:MAG: hypothetical protein AVDCRST_MAG30-2188 [uncultured Solirubrobacteraceae bacterium]|uniref:Uncharacterized protein n=1 Tax=uncultured Solirubrobacteraceae bacterium TaxID=1162706 RepID=A0A6J4SUU8_9ACTN|nr:MAG: hypothetical protein AVDCRST_MAG30-2188 [uncultured Solirubrobacteraceae bacterium]